MTNNNNFAAGSPGFQIYFKSTAGGSFLLNGNSIIFYDWGGAAPNIQNEGSTYTHVIGFPVSISHTLMNINGNSGTAGPLTFNSTATITTPNDATARTLQLNNGNGSGTITLSGVISQGGSGNLGLTKQGANGTVVLTAANTYSGTTTINAGTLQFGDGGTAGSSANSAISMASGAVLLFNRSDAPTYANTITLSGASGSNVIAVANTRSATLTGAISSSGAELWVGNAANSGTLTINRSANSFSVSVVISSGTLSVPDVNTAANNQSSGRGGIYITSAAFQYTGAGSNTTDRIGAFALQGSGSTTTIDVSNATGILTLSASLGNNASGKGFTKAGSGTLILSGANGTGTVGNNAFDGAIVISAGILRAANATALGTTGGGVTVASGAALELIGGITVGNESLGVSGTGLSNGGALRSISGNNTYQGTITLNAASRINADLDTLTLDVASGNAITGTQSLTLGGAGSITVNDPMNISTAALTKDGIGTLTIGGENTYSGGTLISAGALSIGAGGTAGSLSGAITNNASLIFNRSDAVTFASVISGTGTLTKQGAGTLSLTAANTYSGGTLISAGALSVGAGSTVGSISGAVTNNASLIFNRSDAVTFASVISGTGTLTKQGASTLSLTAANTYSGGTLISNGAISIGAGGTVGSISGAVTNNASLIFNRSDAVTFASVISGTGTLTKQGAGTLSLTAANTYSGGTLISAGAISVGAGGTVGSISGAVTNNASLIFNRSDAISYASIISGTGTLTKQGASTLTLSGANTYSGGTLVSAGTLIGSTTSIQGNITNNAAVNFDQSTDGTFSGVMSGTGAMNKSGAGALTMSANSTYSGNTIVSNGTVIMTGTASNSAFSVASGTFLYGSGAVGSLTVSGQVSAGSASNTVGNLRASSLNLQSSGRMQVNFASAGNMNGTAGTDWDVITVGGGTGTYTANAVDGTDFVIALKGNPTFVNTQGYTNIIVNAGTATAFATNKFTIDTSEFTPSLGNGSFTVDASGGDLRLIFIRSTVPDVSVSGNGTAIANGDTTASAADHTDFGDILVDGGTLTRTFTITNTGSGVLGLGNVTVSAVTGSATNFIVTSQPAASVLEGGSTTFNVQFNPSAPGVVTANLSFTNNTPTKTPYSFYVQGTGTFVEIAVTVSGSSITDGSASPSTANGTDFGNVGTAGSTSNITYTITNSGNRAMTIGSVTTSGTHAADFIVTSQPSATLNPSNVTSFTVQFNPSANGLRSAALSFSTTDDSYGDGATENPFNFSIQGTGAGTGISNLPTSLSFSSLLGNTPAAQTFSVTNVGLGTLSYAIATNATWLSVAAVSGSATAGAGNVHTATVQLVAGMTAGTSNATITITGNDGFTTNSPKTVSVSWTISGIPDPSAQTATANGRQLVNLAWTKNASYDVMIIHSAGVITDPAQGTSYSVGNTIGAGTVIYKGTAATLDHVVAAGSTANYKFYSINNNYYSTGVTASVTMGSFGTTEVVEPFGYTNGVSLGSLSGGNGWTSTWSVGSGTWTINSGMTAAGVYPSSAGYAVRLTNPGDGGSGNATRYFAQASTGTLYFAAVIRYGFDGANKFAGIDLSSNGTTMAYIGKDYVQSFRFGIESGGNRSVDSGYDFNPADGGNGASTNNQYLIIARYNFDTDTLNGLVYYKTTAVPATEPGSWNVTLNSVAIGSLNSVKLSAGAASGGQIGDVYYDEIRVARSWSDLMRLTQPVATNYVINAGTNVTDGQITGGTFTVMFDFYDTAGLSNSATIPQFDLWNSTGTRILTNRAFSSVTYSDSGRSQRASNTTHAGASGSAVVLGVYTSVWTAVNSNGVQISNSDSLSNGTKTTFTVIDDDTSAPVLSSFTGMGRTLASAIYTNAEFTSGFVITGLVTDAQSGVYGGTSNRWTLFRDGTTVNSGNFTALFADGTAVSSNGQLTATIAASDLAVSGNYTLRVFSANFDIDRTGDSESTTSDFQFQVRAATITVSTGTLAFSNLLETATSGNLSYNISGTNLTGNISVTSPPPFEISTNASTGFGNSLVITQTAGVVSSRALFVRFRPEGSGDASFSTSIVHASFAAITQTVTASGTVLDRPNAQANATANPTTAFLGDTVTLRVDADQTWRSNNRSFATVFGRYDNTDLTSGTVQGTGVDPGFTADLVTASTPQLTNTGTFYWALRVSYQSGNDFFYDAYRATWADMVISLPSSSSQSITVNPLSAPSPGTIAVDADNRATRIDLTWTRWNSRNVLITYATATPSGSPVNGTTYTPGQTFGNQTVFRGSDAGTSIEVTNLLPGTTYHISLYSENNGYYSTGATFAATATELPRARNLNGAATPSQPATIFLGDSSQTFAFESWGTLEQNYGQAFLWLRAANADLPGGTRFSGAGFTNVNPKTATSGTFTSTGTWYWGMQMDYGAPYGTNFWYKNSSATWEQMSDNGLGSSLSVTVSPIEDPSGQTAVSNGTGRIDVSWTRNARTNNVMVLRKTTAQSWTEPTQGTIYTNGQAIGSGVVVFNGSATSASATGLVGGTTYDFKLYSVNNNYYSPGVTAQATTIKDAQTAVVGTLSGSNIYSQGSVTVTASGGQGTGAYDFRQNGGSGAVSFTGSDSSRTITGDAFGTAVIEVRKLGDAQYGDSDWSQAGTVTVLRGYLNDWEATSNLTVSTGGNLTAYGITWYLTNSIATTGNVNDVKNGIRSARVTGSITMLDPKRGGVSNLSFKVAKFTTQNPDVTVEYSTNGTIWTVALVQTVSSASFVTISTNLMLSGDVYLRFTRTGTGTRTFNIDDILLTDFAPDVFVLGTNSQVIASGSVATSATNGTDFGTVNFLGAISVTNAFSITNSGAAPLIISGVSTSSAMGAAADFQVLSWPTRVEAGARSNLLIRFDPSSGGARTALVTIANNDIYKTNYTFVLSGTGAEPEIGVSGNGVDITDGDATPSLADHTDFGSTNVASGIISRTYTITNSGTFLLTNGTVTISGTHAADFSVTTQPSNSVAVAGSTTFTVAFDPSNFGTRSAAVSFGNNDADENPFNFSIQGTGIAPDIDVRGNNQSITNNDAVPSTADHTDFGAVDFVFDTLTRTYTITNIGNSALTLGTVTTSGTHAAEFVVVSQPVSPVAAGSSTTFQVRFDPVTNGVRTATLTFTNDDPDENPFIFTVQGTGTSTPEIAVLGTNLALLASGTTATSASNGTDFGAQSAVDGFVERTFFITNSGSASLTISGVATGGAHASDFVIASFPASLNPFTVGNLTVRFDPITSGGRTAVVSIANNDLDEASYTFTLTGTGLNTATVATATSSSITPRSAVVGGTVVNDGEVTVTNRGVVFNTSGSPTLADTVLPDVSNGTGAFNITMTNLTPGQIYYYRAYAQNAIGTSYGGVSNFTALCFTEAVSNLQVTATNITDFSASWSALAGAAAYRVDVSTNANFFEVPVSTTLANFSFSSPEFLDATTLDGAITSSPFSVSSGSILTNVSTGTYFDLEPYIESTGGWNASVATTAKAYRVTLGPLPGTRFTITGVHFHVYAETNGPSALTLNVDGGSTIITTNLAATNFVSFERSVTNVSLRSSPVTIQIQGWTNGSRATTGTGLLKMDELRVYGFVTPDDAFVSGYSNRTENGTSITVTGLTSGVQYFIRVRGAGAADCFSSNSSTQSAYLPGVPTLGPVSVSSIQQNSALLTGEILSEERSAITARGFAWGTSPDPTGNELAQGGTATGVFSQTRSGIPSGNLIYFRAWATNGIGKTYSTNGSFWTLSAPPFIGAAQNVQAFQFDAVWLPAIGATNYYLDVSTVSNFSSVLVDYDNLSTEGATSMTVSNLDAATVYYYRIRSENPSGIGSNSVVASVTTEPTVPDVTTIPVSNVTIVTVASGVEVNYDGGAPVASRGVVYGTNAAPDLTDTVVSLGSGNGSAAVTISNLLPNTRYFLRAFATNIAGAAYGGEYEFTTLCFTSAPSLLPVTIGASSFIANWQPQVGAADYLVDVSTNATFGGAGRRTGVMVGYQFDTASSPVYLGPNTLDQAFTATVVTVSRDTIASNQTASTLFTNRPYISSSANWTSTTPANAKFFQFTLYPQPGEFINVTGIYFRARGNKNGPTGIGFNINSNTASFTTNLPNNGLVIVSRAITNMNNVTNPVVVRIHGGLYGLRTDSNGSGQFDIDNLELSGTTGVDPSFIPGYVSRVVTNTSVLVTGLTFNSTYYLRIRGDTESGCISSYSVTQTVVTAGFPTLNNFTIRGTGVTNSVTDSDLLSGTYTITGSLFEAVAGIAVSNEVAPRFVILNSTGAIAVATNFFTTPFTNGSIGPVVVTGTGATGTYANITLGNFTSRIFAATAALDTPGATSTVAFAVTDDDTNAPSIGGFSLLGGLSSYDLRDESLAFTGTVTDASGFGTGYFLLRDIAGNLIQSNTLYGAGGNSVTGTMTAANFICDNIYTASVFVLDGDDDRPGDASGATNFNVAVISSVGGVGGEAYFPTASNATVNGTFLSNSTARTLTDGDMLNGGWSAGLWLSHPDLLYTNADTPSISIRNSSGVNVINRMKLTNITYAGQTYMMTNENLPSASYSQITLGNYAILWSASNISACIASVADRGVFANGTNIFQVIDDDTNGPSVTGFAIPGGLRTVDVSVALSGFAITGLIQDAVSGIGFTSAPPYLLLLNTDGSVLASNLYTAGSQGAGLSSGASVTGWLAGVTLSCGNIYTVRVVAADADNDRAGDNATISSNAFTFTVRGPGGTPPTASNLLINNTNSTTATLLDSQVATGGWRVALSISHPTLNLVTSGTPPTFTIRNSDGVTPYLSGSFGWSNSGGTALSRVFSNSFITAASTNLITTGMYSIVWSAETEGLCYGLATNSAVVSPGTNTFTVLDDDSTGPAFTGTRAGPVAVAQNCADSTRTNLSAGDIAIVALNQSSPADGFAFVNTVDIPSGTTISFTDNGWRSGALTLRTNEGTITWRATNCVPVGTVIRWQTGANPVFSRGQLVSTAGTFVFPLNNGEQLLAYQGPATNPVFIYALNNSRSNGTWDVDATADSSSALPAGLINGFSAIALPRVDHVALSTSTVAVAGERTEVLNFVSSSANWINSASTGYNLTNLPYTFPRLANTVNSIFDGTLAAGGWVITGLVQDAASGLIASGDDAIRYALIAQNGSTVLASNFFSTAITNGSRAQHGFSQTNAALDFSNGFVGVATVRVFAADTDGDRINDSASSLANVELDVRDDDADPPQISSFLINGKTIITDPSELSSAVISGQVRDVTSGMAFSSAPPSYVVYNSFGASVSSGTFTNLPSTDGAATNWTSIRTASLNLLGIADCGTYTVRVSVADADNDRPSDRLQTNLSFVINVASAGGASPQASNLRIDAQAAGGATVTDEQIGTGNWMSSLEVSHPEGLYTEQPYLPSFRVVNPASTLVLQGDWESITEVNDSLYLTNSSHAIVAYTAVELGTYQLSWFARNLGACFVQTGFASVITGGTNTFTVVDEDTTGPVPATNFSWTGSSWTNTTAITISWSSNSFEDASGVSQVRLLTNALQAPGLTNGTLAGGSSIGFTNIVEGISTTRLFAVDADNDRANDTAAGVVTNIVMKLDFTAPPAVSSVVAPNENGIPLDVEDDMTQVSLRWTPASQNESVAAGAPAGKTLSPFQTYRVYYTENSSDNRWPDTSDEYFDTTDDFTELGSYAATNILLTDLTPGTEYRFAIAGVDQAGNVGTLVNAGAPVRTRMLIITNAIVNEHNQVELFWAGSGESSYDVIYADASGYTNGINSAWKLAGTVQTNHFIDAGASDRVAPTNLADRTMRFYRVAPANAWVPSADREGVASSNVVAVARYQLQAGHNIVGIGVQPFSNTMEKVFGLSRLPSTSEFSSANSNTTVYLYRSSTNFTTQNEWYNLVYGGVAGTNYWMFTSNGADFVSANTTPAPLADAVSIRVPVAANLLVVGEPRLVPTTEFFTKSITTGQYNAVSFPMAVPVKIKDIPDLKSKSQGNTSPLRTDRIIILDNTVNPPKAKYIIYRKSSDNKFYYNTGALAEDHLLAPGESIVFQTHPTTVAGGSRSSFTVDLTPSAQVLATIPAMNTKITNSLSARPALSRLEAFDQGGAVELSGRVNPNLLLTTYWFTFGTSASNITYTSPLQNLAAANNPSQVSVTVTGVSGSAVYYYALYATNQVGTATLSSSLFVGCPVISITNTSLPPVFAGVPYNTQLYAAGGQPPYRFQQVSGNMYGLSVNTNGLISGTTTFTNMNFTIRVTDNLGCFGTRNFTLGSSGGN